MKKIISVAVILLFIGFAFVPSITADINNERMVRIPVIEYKADGTREKTIVKMSWSEVKELEEKLQSVKNPDERLSLYQKYGLIPQDVTIEKIREGMFSLAEKLNISKERLSSFGESCKSANDVRYGFGIDFFSEVYLIGIFYFNVPVGLSFFTGIINMILQIKSEMPNYIPSFDLLHFYYFPVFGQLETWHETNYVLQMSGLYPIPFFCLFFGFVGFYFQSPIICPMGGAFGASIATVALGLKYV